MLGLMQSHPLLISNLIEFAARHHGDGEIVSRRTEGDLHRYTWKDVAARSRQVANALDASGLAAGDRVGTLAWNGYRHLELYFGVSGSPATPPCGTGRSSTGKTGSPVSRSSVKTSPVFVA